MFNFLFIEYLPKKLMMVLGQNGNVNKFRRNRIKNKEFKNKQTHRAMTASLN